MIKLNNEKINVDTTWDGVIIEKYIDGVTCGKSLDLTGFTDKVLKCGHVVIKEDGKYKPAPITDGAYGSLAGKVIVGVVYKTHIPEREGTPIMTRGKVNEKAYKNWTGVEYTSEIKTALKLIEFKED